MKGKGVDDCWLWQGATTGSTYEYGAFQYRRADGSQHRIKAHRFAWEQANQQSVPDGFCVCHRCDVPLCVNPSHLFIGTVAANLTDARRKGRLDETRARTRKLTPDERAEIFLLVKHGEKGTSARLARLYGVSKAAISSIASGRFTTTTERIR